MKRPVLIGITGGTGSGKSTISKAIYSKFNEDCIAMIEHDSYYKNQSGISFEERMKTNYDHPSAFDTDLMLSHLKDLIEGKSIEKPCSKCRGTGEMLAKRKISIKIPAGVDSGSRLRVANEGEPGILGGPKGDLYVYIFVRPHKEFERNGNDVISRVNISFAQAALGATIQVNTLDGKVELKIPEGTQTGTAFRVKGKGIPYLRNPNQRGDQHIVVTVQTPKKLTDTQRELLLRFANESNEDVNNLQVSKSLFEKIKDCLTK